MKTPDEIAREIVMALPAETKVATKIAALAGLHDAIAAALTAEREAREKAEAEVARYQSMIKHMVGVCDDLTCVFIDGIGDVWLDYDDARLKRAEKAEAEAHTARADALREAAAPYGQNPTGLFAGTSVEATLLRLIDKDAP